MVILMEYVFFIMGVAKDRDDATNGKTFSVSLGAMAVVIVIKICSCCVSLGSIVDVSSFS